MHHRLGSPITAYEQETAAPVRQRQDRGVSPICGYRLHRDVEGFATGLIVIGQPQLRPGLSRAQLKAKLPGAVVHVCKRRF
jgi:hypothetical protein